VAVLIFSVSETRRSDIFDSRRKMFETIVVDRKDEIDVVTLNRPKKLNALNLKMMDEFISYLT